MFKEADLDSLDTNAPFSQFLLPKQFEEKNLKLSERDRQLITLCTMNKLPQKEVALILKCSETSVRVGLHRARERLMKLIGIDRKKLSGL